MAYPPKRIVKQLLQFRKRRGMNIPQNIGSIYEDTLGRQSAIIDLNRADETPKGDERYLCFVVVDPLRQNNMIKKSYEKQKDVKSYKEQQQ
ncbi:hypothetical protein ACFL5K_05620 [Gemmatimonadota bacterium]